MKLSFKAKYFLLVGWQIVLLLGLIAPKYITLATGSTILLETVPVDPRELFRGDYVALRYKISRLNFNSVQKRLGKAPLKRGDPVYVVLAPPPISHAAKKPQGWKAVAVFRSKPTDDELASYAPGAVFMRGKVLKRWKHVMELEYGLESYFVPEGKGLALERAPAGALTVEVKVDRNGRAVIQRLLLYGKPVSWP